MNFVILHGWGSCAERWQKVKELLEDKGLKVFVPDLPGFGQEPPPTVAWDIDDYVEWVKNYIKNLAASGELVEPFFLLGHSFGGAVAAKYAIKYPDDVEKLFLAAASGIRRKTFKKEFFKKVSPFFRKTPLLKRIFYRFILRSDYPYTQGIMRENYLKVISEDLSTLFSSISLPTIIIWGDKDKDTPLADAYFISKEIKNSKLEVLPGIGHRIRDEAPEILVQKILENLK